MEVLYDQDVPEELVMKFLTDGIIPDCQMAQGSFLCSQLCVFCHLVAVALQRTS